MASVPRFEFATATRILFGPGVLKEIGPAARSMGRRALVFLGLPEEQSRPLMASLEDQGVGWVRFQVNGEPTVDMVQQVLELARNERCDLTIGCGGGSAMDSAKATAVLLANGGDPLDYLEVIGRGRALEKPSIPCIAVPTTAGTGAEVTRNAVLGAADQKVKVSLRSPTMLPRLALIDPTLTYALPPEITASTGLDALTQLVEPYASVRATPITDALCRDGMQMAARSLQRVYFNGNDKDARLDMSLASLYGGLALANSGLGAAHGFAGIIGGMYHAPHGAVCARLLPFVVQANLEALRKREPQSLALGRYEQVAQILCGDPGAKAEMGVSWLLDLCQALNIRPLNEYGVTAVDIPEIVTKSAVASSMKANPIVLNNEELTEIMRLAI